jgi:hypothetical protein
VNNRLRVIVFFFLCASTHWSAAVVLGQQSETIYWSKNEFTIPFHIDNDGSQPSAVLLEISTDEGMTWLPYARDGVRARQFRFTSQGDGLYLFRIKTIDNLGQAFDPGAEPLRVLVDTTSPELTLEVDTDARGQLIASFAIIETNPKIESIRLEYQTEFTGSWIAANFDTNRKSSTELSGRGMLNVSSTVRQLVVRLVAKDAAGNESEVTRLPQLPRTATAPTGMQLASGRNSPPTSPFSNNAQFSNSQFSNSQFSNTKTSNAQLPGPQGNTSVARLGSGPTLGLPGGPTITAVPSPTTASGPTSKSNGYQFQPITKDTLISTNVSVDAQSDGLGSLPSIAASQDLNASPLFLGGASGDSVQLSNQPQSASPIALSVPSPARAPTGTTRSIDQKPYHSSSKAFSLDYAVDQRGGSQVASVELWGTVDQGQIWELWGTDPDGKTPFDISVETEGLFGFRMVLVGANGMSANRPRNGDNADAWIHVDTKLPSARIVSAVYGRGNESGALVIEFSAQDEQFSDRPIKLSYSEVPTGPWTTIVSGYENSGRYVWRADPNLPARVYLQIEAFDQAGNIGAHRLELPVDIEGLAPRGRIQGFRPIPQ